MLYLSAIFFYKLLKFLLEYLELFVTQWQSIFVGSQNQFGYLSTVELSAKFPQHTRLSASLTDYLLVTNSSCCSILNWDSQNLSLSPLALFIIKNYVKHPNVWHNGQMYVFCISWFNRWNISSKNSNNFFSVLVRNFV